MSTTFKNTGSGTAVLRSTAGGVASFIVSVVPPTPSGGVVATGGTVTTYSSGGTTYKVHTFTTSGTFTVTSGGSVDVLCVGGGGAGRDFDADGRSAGGGGGYVTSSTLSVSPGAISITVGSGGYSVQTIDLITLSTSWSIVSGTASSFGSFVVAPPGGDAYANLDTFDIYGGASQSGVPPSLFLGGAGAGNVYGATYIDGGAGIQSSISGTATYYGGGGGGTDGIYFAGTGGLGGGGNGGTYYTQGTDGTPNTGGGAGSELHDSTGRSGGSGIVIIRYTI